MNCRCIRNVRVFLQSIYLSRYPLAVVILMDYFCSNKTFSFGYLMVEKNLQWFRKLLEYTLPVENPEDRDNSEETAEKSAADKGFFFASDYRPLLSRLMFICVDLITSGW